MKRILSLAAWIVAGTGCLVLLAAAVHNNNKRVCSGLSITIEGNSGKLFIDQSEVRRIIAERVGGNVTGKAIRDFDLKSIEDALEKDIWILEAKLYFDNNEKFRVSVKEREPVARIFTAGGNSYYIDSSLVMLPLSDLFSARLTVFTGFPSDKKVLSRKDSALLREACMLSMKIRDDEFLSAMIDQVNITGDREFEMIPKVGNQVIELGDAGDADDKLAKLRLFYKTVMPRAGWNKYNRITLKYKGQIVAGVRGKNDLRPDSLRATELLKLIAERAEKMAADSTPQFNQLSEKNPSDVTMIQNVVARDEDGEDKSTGGATAKPAKPSGKAAVPVRSPSAAPDKNKNKPKATMPSKSNTNKKN